MDMVTMNIADGILVSICREMGMTLMRTSYSTIFNEVAGLHLRAWRHRGRNDRRPAISARRRSAACRC